MIDYERFDHTYCRLLKDGEEISSRKRSISSASHDAVLDSDTSGNQLPSQSHVFVEKENGNVLRHEPVIIVRTKKPRKTAPIIVRKSGNKDDDIVRVNALPTVEPQVINAVVAKNKLVHPVQDVSNEPSEMNLDNNTPNEVEDKDNAKEEPSTKEKGNSASENSDKSISLLKHKVETIQTTKSGRARKLTAKAIQNSEDSKKGVKSPKTLKANVEGGTSVTKKRRGRPSKKDAENADKKPADEKPADEKPANGESADGKSAGGEPAGEKPAGDKPASQTKAPGRPKKLKTEGVGDQPTGAKKAVGRPKKKGAENPNEKVDGGTKARDDENQPTTDSDDKDTKKLVVEKNKRDTKKSTVKKVGQLPGSVVDDPKEKSSASVKSPKKSQKKASAKPSKSKMKSPPQSKRGTKAHRSKLVVVTKPPPRRRSQPEPVAEKPTSGGRRKSRGKGIPSAKVDENNIVGGTRRRN